MNFDEFRDTYFDGNTEAAFEQLAKESYNHNYTYTKNRENLKIILDSMSSETASRYMKFYGREAAKNPEYFSKAIEMAMDCAVLKLSVEQIEATDKNPFFNKLLFDIIVGPIVILIFVGVILLIEQFNLQNDITMFLSACILLYGVFLLCKAIIDLRKTLCFRKVKKFISHSDRGSNI